MIYSKNLKVINFHTVYILREDHIPKAKTSLLGMPSPKKKCKVGSLSWGWPSPLLPTDSSYVSPSSIPSTLMLSTQTLVLSPGSQFLQVTTNSIAPFHLLYNTQQCQNQSLRICSHIDSLYPCKRTYTLRQQSHLFYPLLYPQVAAEYIGA